MTIKYDIWNNIENSNIYLCNPGQGKSYILNGIDKDSCSYTENLKDFDTISFTVNKYIEIDGERKISNGYNSIDVLKELHVDNIGRFVISTPPAISADGEIESKEVSAKSIEYKFVYKNLINFKINTGEYDSYERLVENNIDALGKTTCPVILYNSENAKLSLLDILCNIAGGDWSVGYVDEELKNKACYFSIENQDIYSFIMQDMSKSFKCIFKFDTINKTINAFSEDNIGEDTNVFISFRNLANKIDISPYTENLYTRFTVRGSDNLDIAQVNFGEDKIENISYYLNTYYLPQTIIEKYTLWQSYRESRREDYIENMKAFISKQESRDEIINRVPCDPLNYDWNRFSKEELEKEKDYFSSLTACIEKDFKDDTGNIDMQALQSSPYWHDYYSYTTWIIPNIETAIKNADKIESEKDTYDNTWKTDWNLYGTNELSALIKTYQEQTDSTKDYKKAWNELSESEKLNFSSELSYTDIHNAYLKACDNLEGATAKYNELILLVNNYQKYMDKIQSDLSDIAFDVSIHNEKFNFTEKELNIINDLYIDTDYTNENFVIKSLYTQEEKVDEELLLLEDALDQLSKESQPQYSFSCDLDNLFNIPEFKSWHGSFKVGNFIRLGTSDIHHEKLRLISVTYNPMVKNNDLKIEFSNMLTYNGKRSDLSSLFDESISSSKNSISYGSSSSDSDNDSNTTELLKYILNSRILNEKIDSLKLNNLVATDANIKSASVKFLKTDELAAKIADIGYLTAEDADLKYANIDMANVTKATFGKIFANIGLITSATIKEGHITGFLDSVEVNANSITAGTLIADRLLLKGSKNGLLYQLNNLGELTSTSLNTLDGSILTQRSINCDKIVTGTITANEIAAGTITADKLNVNNVSAAVAQIINLDAAKITSGTISADRIDINNLFAKHINSTGGISTTGTYAGGITFKNTISGGVFTTYVADEELGRITPIKITDTERYFSILLDKATALSLGTGAIGDTKAYYFMNNGGNPRGITQRHQFIESVYIEGVLNTRGLIAAGNSNSSYGYKVKMWTDNEGGNIQITSPDTYNGRYYQFDAFNGNLRIYTGNNTSENTASMTLTSGGILSATGGFKGTLDGRAGAITVLRTTADANTSPGLNSMTVKEQSPDTLNLPTKHWYHVYSGQGSDANYNTQLAAGMTNTAVYYRNKQNGTWGTWRNILMTSGGVLTENYFKVGKPDNAPFGVELGYNTEGGNISWYAPDGTRWEFDCAGNVFRLFNYSTYKNFLIDKNGNATFPANITAVTLNGCNIGGSVVKNNNGLVTGGTVHNSLGNIQIVEIMTTGLLSTSGAVVNGSTAILSTSFSLYEGSTNYIVIPTLFRYCDIENISSSGGKLNITVRNISGASHTLSASFQIIYYKYKPIPF